jgi:hypothetical protein
VVVVVGFFLAIVSVDVPLPPIQSISYAHLRSSLVGRLASSLASTLVPTDCRRAVRFCQPQAAPRPQSTTRPGRLPHARQSTRVNQTHNNTHVPMQPPPTERQGFADAEAGETQEKPVHAKDAEKDGEKQRCEIVVPRIPARGTVGKRCTQNNGILQYGAPNTGLASEREAALRGVGAEPVCACIQRRGTWQMSVYVYMYVWEECSTQPGTQRSGQTEAGNARQHSARPRSDALHHPRAAKLQCQQP